jgi:hypothetical protein
MKTNYPFSFLSLLIFSNLFLSGCSYVQYQENENFEEFFHQITPQEYTSKAILIIPMNNSCSSCRKMTLRKVPYFLTFENMIVIFSDFGEKNIRMEIDEEILAKSNVLIDSKFLSKRYDLLTDYPIMVFSNEDRKIHIKSISASTFYEDMDDIRNILL